MLHSDEGNIFDLARHRLDVAKEDLETAISNLKEEHYRAANNRAYYSIYHSICAVFALEDIMTKSFYIYMTPQCMLRLKLF